MTFELGKQYIVKVTGNGIIPTEEFKRERFFDKDHDSLDFLTDEEKTVVINDVLDKVRAEIDLETRIQVKHYTNTEAVIDAVLDIIDEYKAEMRSSKSEIKSCNNCAYHTDADEIHGITLCGSCGVDLKNFKRKAGMENKEDEGH